MTGMKDFSTDAPSNDVAAPPIFWGEGQSAGSVNNSAREEMAAVARWLADVSGGLGATGGSSGAYSVTTNQGFTAADYTKAFELAFFPDADNVGPCTLNPDSAGAKPLVRPGGAQCGPGDIRVATIYKVRWHPGIGTFTVVSPAFEDAGTVKAFAGSGLPKGWLPCVGAPVSRTTHAALFAAIGTTWGAGDGATTFNLPNFQGRTLFGVDSNAGRLTGAGGLGPSLGSIGGSETVILSGAQMPRHTHGGSTSGAGGHDHGGSVAAAGQHSHGGATGAAGGHTHGGATGTAGAHQHTGTTATAGSHGHAVRYAVGTAGSGSSNRAVTDIAPNGTANAGGASDAAGEHTHDFTTAAAGDHSHGVTIAAVGDHAHAIGADGNHAHPIAAVGDHAHGLSIDLAGSSEAHGNVPPGAVIVWAIKT